MLNIQNRFWKTCGASFLLVLGTALIPVRAYAASPEFAYTEEKWATLRDNVLEFDEIRDLVHEYNTTVLQNQLSWNEYKGKSRADIAKEYYNAADDMLENISYPDDEDPSYASRLSSALSSEIQAENLVEQGDNNVEDETTIKLGYAQEEAQIAQQAENLMIQYWSQLAQLETLSDAVMTAEKNYQSVLTKRAAGMAVLSDEKSAEESVIKAQMSLNSAESSLEATKKELCILLGWSYSDEVEIGALPDPDLDYINSIDSENDITKALENSYSLKIAEKQVENSQSASLRKTYQETYENSRNSAATTVRNSYNSLILALSSYEQAKASQELEENELAAASLRLEAGIITQNTYDSQEKAYTSARVNTETYRLSLLQAQLDYQWAIGGLAS